MFMFGTKEGAKRPVDWAKSADGEYLFPGDEVYYNTVRVKITGITWHQCGDGNEFVWFVETSEGVSIAASEVKTVRAATHDWFIDLDAVAHGCEDKRLSLVLCDLYDRANILFKEANRG